MTGRRRLSLGIGALAALLLFATALAWYVRAAVLDSAGFADRATETVEDACVRTLIAERVTDQVVLRHQADLVTARPIIAPERSGMSELIAVAYPDRATAERVRDELARLTREQVIEIEDAVVVTHEPDGKVKLHQTVNPTGAGAAGSASTPAGGDARD